MQAVLDREGNEWVSIASLFASAIFAWVVYVPLHELLHAFGCLATGGSVSELEIARIYGGDLLAAVFPFVQAGGEYAGRLSGFDTHGSDFVYVATVYAPFVLTLLFASFVSVAAAGRVSAVLTGVGAVLYVAPAVSLFGDFYELGSILISGVWVWALDGTIADQAMRLRHDDVFLLIGQFPERFPDDTGRWAFAAGLSFLAGLALLTLTLAGAQMLGRRRFQASPDVSDA